MELIHERMNDIFEKFHIIGLPFKAAFHHFTGKDTGDAHDHPFGFTSQVISGGFLDRVYKILENKEWRYRDVFREPGASYTVQATHIHKVIDLPTGDCWTFVMPGVDERVSCFWRFEKDKILSRAWNELEFTPYVK